MMLIVSSILVLAGFLAPFWPLSMLGIVVAALSGRWIAALILGFLLDSAYGAPGISLGPWHFLYFPFTLAALVCICVHYYFAGHIRKAVQNTL